MTVTIPKDNIKMDIMKVNTIWNWKLPEKIKNVQAFLGFANFYCRFILRYSRTVPLLTDLTKTNVLHSWDVNESAEITFTTFKKAFTSGPILEHFDSDKEITVETDLSDDISVGVSSQHDTKMILFLVTFVSRKNLSAEHNYEIYDNELLAIRRYFEGWYPNIYSTDKFIK